MLVHDTVPSFPWVTVKPQEIESTLSELDRGSFIDRYLSAHPGYLWDPPTHLSQGCRWESETTHLHVWSFTL